MMGLPLGFAQPLVLLGLLSIPVLWWLLRLIPPQPRRINFPPTRLLFQIQPKQETPSRTPWWLTLLRLTLATIVILAAAGPLWNPPVETASSKAAIALLIDDGFVAAGTWDARMRTAEDLVARAEADNRAVALIPLSEPSRDISFETPAAARVRIKQLKPNVDERGYLMELLRGSDEFFTKFGQCYVSLNYPGVVRAWHYHKKQEDYFVVVQGVCKVGLYDMREVRRRGARPKPITSAPAITSSSVFLSAWLMATRP